MSDLELVRFVCAIGLFIALLLFACCCPWARGSKKGTESDY